MHCSKNKILLKKQLKDKAYKKKKKKLKDLIKKTAMQNQISNQ